MLTPAAQHAGAADHGRHVAGQVEQRRAARRPIGHRASLPVIPVAVAGTDTSTGIAAGRAAAKSAGCRPMCAARVVQYASGGGDSSVAGLACGFLAGMTAADAVEWGAHAALAKTTPGDTSMVTRDEVEWIVRGGTARVRR